MPPKDSKVESRNMGTLDHSPTTEVGKPRRPARNDGGGGVSVLVRARESRVHGKGRQGVGTLQKPEERPVDSGLQADQAWLLNVQKKLYQWSREHADPNEHEQFLMSRIPVRRYRRGAMGVPDYAMTPGEPDA